MAGGSPARERIGLRGLFVERRDDAIGARVLPDDGVVPGTSGLRVPDDGGFALVRDADRGEIGGRQAGAVQGAGDRFVDAGGDLQGIVLDPAGPGQNLIVFDLVAGDLLAVAVEDHESRAGRSLINCADVSLHRGLLGSGGSKGSWVHGFRVQWVRGSTVQVPEFAVQSSQVQEPEVRAPSPDPRTR